MKVIGVFAFCKPVFLLINKCLILFFSGETVLNFLNENWKEILDEFGKPIIETIIRITFNGIKKFFHQVPKSEIYIE